MKRIRLVFSGLFLVSLVPFCAGNEIDALRGNILPDGELRYGAPEKDGAKKIFLKTPRYWKVTQGGKTFAGHDIPFDTETKYTGDCSIRIEGTGGKNSFTRTGYGDTSRHLRHGWAYAAKVHLKSKDVKGDVWVEIKHSWDTKKSTKFSGTKDWFEVPVDFTLSKGTNLLQFITVYFQGKGTVWIDNIQLVMKNPDAYEWWESWAGSKVTTRLSSPFGVDEKAGILPIPPREEEYDKYGGCKAIKAKATGFFRLEQIDGKWWLISPEGHAYFMIAMFCPGRPFRNRNKLLEKLEVHWAVQIYKRLTSWGFNSTEWQGGILDVLYGRYSPPPKELVGKNFAHSVNVRFELCTQPKRNGGINVPMVDWGWQRFPDVFSSEFEQAVKNYGNPKQKGSHFKTNAEDPWIIGYQLADEPPWYGPEVWYGSLADGFHQRLPDNAPGKQRLVRFFKEKYGNIKKINKSWGMSYASWQEMFDPKKPFPRNKAAVRDKREFMGVIADRWYALAAAQVRKHDPNHLILGANATRLYPEVMKAEAKYCEAISTSAYGFSGVHRSHPDFDYYLTEQLYKWTGRPVMTGFAVGVRDAGGVQDWGSADSAALRGHTWRAYLRKAAQSPACIGVAWWAHTSRRTPNSEGYEKTWGILSNDNEAYMDTLPALQEANFNVYHYRRGMVPARIEPPTRWQPIHHSQQVSDTISFKLLALPYPVDNYEIQISRDAEFKKAEIVKAKPDKKRKHVTVKKILSPGQWFWRARSLTKEKVSTWNLPWGFTVLDAPQIKALNSVGEFLANGDHWQDATTNYFRKNVKSSMERNVKEGAHTLFTKVSVEEGKIIRSYVLHCKLEKPFIAKAEVPYAFRVWLKADGMMSWTKPKLRVIFKHGYEVENRYPFIRGWTSQTATEDGWNHLQTIFRLPSRDREITDFKIILSGYRGMVMVRDPELAPETVYEITPDNLAQYNAIVSEYQAQSGK